VAAGAFGVTRSLTDIDVGAAEVRAALAQPAALVTAPGATLDSVIATLETRVESNPADHVAWATLGIAYVQQARVTANGDLYALADSALAESLAVNETDNFLAYAGRSALASAKHDFLPARDFARKGLEINSFSALLHGALSDAELQLGNYPEAFTAVQRMVDLSPDTASLSRASYTWELRGDIEEATRLMQRALDDAPTPADRSFALLHLGDLAFNAGDANTALGHYRSALEALPDSAAALAGKARAEAALGQTETALDDYRTLVARGLEPFYVLQYAQLLESLGRDDESAEQYAIYEQQESEFAAQEVLPDATFTLFFADHGKPEIALEMAEKAVRAAPFLDTWDAYAWALHANGRHEEAWEAIQEALALGTPNALYHHHAGMIRLALGDEAGAVEHLTRALEINPHFQFVAAQDAEETLARLS
jgi:tetratricopeptide (TPR) repeat protein